MTEESLFAAALEQPPAERARFLEHACGSDAALLEHLRALLAAHDRAAGILDRPVATAAHAPPPSEDAGTVVAGRYKLLQRLGEGGMGTVWVAEQHEPVKRRVALKVIKPGMDSAQVVRRFEAERQALALMDHTNIARVLDAGATELGRPYFVMELVKGVPITKYCDELRLSLRERLALFLPVCQAVQHAHQKGIIHRDLKPSNVLVAMQDGRPVPKVIDFGIAKALHQRLTDESIYTELGAVVGTLEYMSPEQAELRPLDIDTRADVYALGVLLYELLTGSTALERQQLRKAAYAEALRLIREVEPPRPSTRLTESQESLAGLAARRRTEPAKLTREVRGELDWIVMKCLEKDRTRRYETANGLARDLERHLADEPVEACPPSRAYRFKKALRKHRAGVLTAAAFALLLLAGVAVSAWQAVRATSAEAEARANERQAIVERDQKEEARKEAVRAEVKALAAAAAEKQATEAEQVQRKKAEAAALAELKARVAEAAQRKQAEAVADLLESVFKGLDPKEAAYDLRKQLVERLDAVAATLDKEYAGRPLVRARLRNVLGTTQLSLGEAGKAVVLQEQVLADARQHLPPDHPNMLNLMNDLALAYKAAGKLDKALPLFVQVLAQGRSKFGPDHPTTLTYMNNLALAYEAAGQVDKALPLLEQTLEKLKSRLPSDHPDTLLGMNNLANAYQHAGQMRKAVSLLEQVLEKQQAKLPPDHPHTLTTMNNLARAYEAVGRLDKALPLLEQTLEKRKAKLGPDHPATLTSMNNLAEAYRAVGKLVKALPLLEQTLVKAKAKLGPDHPSTLTSMNNLASAYLAAARIDEAIQLLEQALDKQKAKLGSDHPDTLTTMNNLARAYAAAGQLDKALPLFEQTLETRKAKLGPDHPATLSSMNNLGMTYLNAGQLDKAVPLMEQTLAKAKVVLGPDHPNTLLTMGNLTLAHEKCGKFDQAEPLLREILERQRKKEGPESVGVSNSLAYLGLNLLGQRKYAEAEPVLRECLAVRAKKAPDSWQTFNSQSMLGASLVGQKKYAEAEPLLLKGYEGMKQRAAQIPAKGKNRLTEALERLVQLYEATDRPEQAAAWRQQLDASRKGKPKIPAEKQP
jgi:tRNA A-37 threonylcarbamoyl transferase component Bud32